MQEDLSTTFILVHFSGSIEDYEERVRNLGDLFTLCLYVKSDGHHSYCHPSLSPQDRMNGSLNGNKEKRGKFWRTLWYCSKKEWVETRQRNDPGEMTDNEAHWALYYLLHFLFTS